MSLISDGVVEISLGDTLIGTDEGNEINVRMEGREAEISHDAPLNGAGIVTKPIGVRSKVRVFRNKTGGVLYAGELFTITPGGGIANMARATAKTSAGSIPSYVVDSKIPAAGVADGDLFLGFVRGPAKALAPAGGLTLSSAGAAVAAGASGRLAVAADTAGTTRTLLGFLLRDDTNATANEMVEVNLSPAWN